MTQNQREGGRAEGELEPSLPPPSQAPGCWGWEVPTSVPFTGPPLPPGYERPLSLNHKHSPLSNPATSFNLSFLIWQMG